MMQRVVVGMSGGVDSSVAAWLLKKQGYDVIGVTVNMWGDERVDEDAGKMAGIIGIPWQIADARALFRREIMDPFSREYLHGRTPNPCVICNRRVKWASLLQCGEETGADYVATGHYARICRLPNHRLSLRPAASAAKDQTYMLYNLTQEQLSHTLFPLGEYEKGEVRHIAGEAGLPVCSKPDSQEVCFIPRHDVAGFVEEYTGQPSRPGNFVDSYGRILGRHRGIAHYTVGQRKGLGVSFGEVRYVREIRPETNEVVLGGAEEIRGDRLLCNRLNFLSVPALTNERHVTAKIRYGHTGAPASIRPVGPDRVECRFDEPVRAITPGQSVVFYEDGLVLGGGTILGKQDS